MSLLKPVLYTVPFLLLFLIPFWPDPDATGIYNAVCLNAPETAIPFLSLALFSILPCSILAWKVVQVLLVLVFLFVVWKEYSLSSLGLVGFFPVFLLTMEDDLFAFLPLFLLSLWILMETRKSPAFEATDLSLDCYRDPLTSRDWRTLYSILGSKLGVLIAGSLLVVFLGFFVWKGAFLVGLILLSYFLYPPLSVIPTVAYLVLNNFDTWGGSAEVVPGSGFLIGQLGLLIVLYFGWKNGFTNKSLLWLLASLELLTFFQPKWGEWLILPLLPLLQPYMEDMRLRVFGAWMFGLIIVFTILTAFPSSGEIAVIQKAVELQDSGKVVLNDWGVGHYFEYYGGVPSAKGGFHGNQNVAGSFWLGPPIPLCETIMFSNNLYLQEC